MNTVLPKKLNLFLICRVLTKDLLFLCIREIMIGKLKTASNCMMI